MTNATATPKTRKAANKASAQKARADRKPSAVTTSAKTAAPEYPGKSPRGLTLIRVGAKRVHRAHRLIKGAGEYSATYQTEDGKPTGMLSTNATEAQAKKALKDL